MGIVPEMQRKFVALTALLASLVACGPSPETKMVIDAEESVKRMLKDPDSAKFSEVESFLPDKSVCGRVNAKNSFGGYSGAENFVVTPAHTVVDADGEFAAMNECTNLLSRSADRINADTVARYGAQALNTTH